MTPLKKDNSDRVTLRDLWQLQKEMDSKIQEIIISMTRYKIKVLIVSAVVSLVVSVTIGLGVKYGLIILDKIIF